jgi:tRNA modification GTPase
MMARSGTLWPVTAGIEFPAKSHQHPRMKTASLTAAVWTPSGRGAVATIRVCGDPGQLSERLVSRLQLASGRVLSDVPLRQLAFGRWSGGSGPSAEESQEAVEEVVVCRLQIDLCEIHCHGGQAAVQRMLADLAEIGCEIVDWPTQLEAERGVWERESAEALSRATTLRAAGWIAAQAGRLERAIAELHELIARGQRAQAAARANEMLAWANFGLHLTRPWEVVLAGRPNVGKSSLINALVGFERSIVFDEPGTTRDVVTADTVLDGWAIRLSDTAGQRDAARDLEAAGIAKAREAFANADARLLLLDVSQPPHDDDHRLLADWPDAIVVAHKADLPDVWGNALPQSAIRVSSWQRTGLKELSSAIVARLIPAVPPTDISFPLTKRHVQILKAFCHRSHTD